jgi:5'-methylthioinosine phosphorylase
VNSKLSKVGIIGGSGVDKLISSKGFERKKIITKYGEVIVEHGEVEGKVVCFVKRHGEDYALPYQVNYRGNIAALKELGVDCIVATAAVGCIDSKMKPGDFSVLSDFIDFTKRRHETFSEKAFVDVSLPYSSILTEKIIQAAKELKIKLFKESVYVCTEGPRFESKAEIKMFGKLGADVVGMTQAAEVVLANEAKLPYAVIAVITNYAAGISSQKVSAEEVIEVMEDKKNVLFALISQTIKIL